MIRKNMNWLFLLLLSASWVGAETSRFPAVRWTRSGGTQGTNEPVEDMFTAENLSAHVQANGLDIEWTSFIGKTKKWHLSPATFQNQVTCVEDECSYTSFPCYGGCIMSPPYVEGYDAKQEFLYFSVVLDVGHNVPHVVFQVDLNKHSVRRLFDVEGSGLGDFSFSPSGSRLGYLISSHGSACAGSRNANFFDLVALKPLTSKLALSIKQDQLRDYTAYESIKWVAESEAEMSGRSWDCDGSVEPNQLHFQAVASVTAPD